MLARLRGGDGDAGWVEPSNAVTRAVLGGAPLELLATVIERAPSPSPVLPMPQRAQPATRTAQRTRRRRASRAA